MKNNNNNNNNNNYNNKKAPPECLDSVLALLLLSHEESGSARIEKVMDGLSFTSTSFIGKYGPFNTTFNWLEKKIEIGDPRMFALIFYTLCTRQIRACCILHTLPDHCIHDVASTTHGPCKNNFHISGDSPLHHSYFPSLLSYPQ